MGNWKNYVYKNVGTRFKKQTVPNCLFFKSWENDFENNPLTALMGELKTTDVNKDFRNVDYHNITLCSAWFSRIRSFNCRFSSRI